MSQLIARTENSTVSWVVMACSSEKARPFRGTSCLHLQVRRVSHAGNQQTQAASSANRGSGSGCFKAGSLSQLVSPWYRDLFGLLPRLWRTARHLRSSYTMPPLCGKEARTARAGLYFLITRPQTSGSPPSLLPGISSCNHLPINAALLGAKSADWKRPLDCDLVLLLLPRRRTSSSEKPVWMQNCDRRVLGGSIANSYTASWHSCAFCCYWEAASRSYSTYDWSPHFPSADILGAASSETRCGQKANSWRRSWVVGFTPRSLYPGEEPLGLVG
jgi:hypothetical protein